MTVLVDLDLNDLNLNDQGKVPKKTDMLDHLRGMMMLHQPTGAVLPINNRLTPGAALVCVLIENWQANRCGITNPGFVLMHCH